MPAYELPRAEWEPILTKLKAAEADKEPVPAHYAEALILASAAASKPGQTDHERLRGVLLVLVAFAHANVEVETQ